MAKLEVKPIGQMTELTRYPKMGIRPLQGVADPILGSNYKSPLDTEIIPLDS